MMPNKDDTLLGGPADLPALYQRMRSGSVAEEEKAEHVAVFDLKKAISLAFAVDDAQFALNEFLSSMGQKRADAIRVLLELDRPK